MGIKITDFENAVENVKKLKTTPPNNDLLTLYGLYKQSTIGDCNTAKPGFLDFKGRAKWDAWNNLQGTSTNDAQKAYVEKVEELAEQIGLEV